MFVLPMPYKSKSALPILSGFLCVQLLAGLMLLMCIAGCDEETNAASETDKSSHQVGGVVKSITPVPSDGGRVMMLIEFENGQVVNVNYLFRHKVFTIHKGKYNLITFDHDCDVTDVQQIEAEINFP